MVLPGRAVEGRGAPRSHRHCPSRNGIHGMASASIRENRFHSSAVHRIGDANAGANRDSAIVLDNGHEGLPVRYLGEPSLEAAPKKAGIVVADRRWRRAWRNVLREHIGGPRPDTIHGSVRGKEEEIS